MSKRRLTTFMQDRVKRYKSFVHPAFKTAFDMESLFFNQKDNVQIMALSDLRAIEVWEQLKNGIRAFDKAGTFRPSSVDSMRSAFKQINPFCYIANNACSKCSYGKNHGVCFSEDKDGKTYRTSNGGLLAGLASYKTKPSSSSYIVEKAVEIFFDAGSLKSSIKKINPLKSGSSK